MKWYVKKLDWRIDAKNLRYDKNLITSINKKVCKTTHIVHSNIDIQSIHTRLLKVDVKTLSYTFNNPAGWNWRTKFLSKYTTPKNVDEVKELLLPKSSVVSWLYNAKADMVKLFGLPTDIQSLFDYQLPHGVLYDLHYRYNLLKNGNEVEVLLYSRVVTTLTLKPEYTELFIELNE